MNKELIQRWAGGQRPRTVLKTDVFEEANGEDHILFDLHPEAVCRVGMDIAASTVERAQLRCPDHAVQFVVADVRSLAFACGSIDLIVSTSTLDHFSSRADFSKALAELVRVLRPGGKLLITLDNPRNPFYPILKWLSRKSSSPFRLGYTTSLAALCSDLQELGLRIEATEALIHNPRILSTALFLGLRRVLGRHADPPVVALLKMFSLLDYLPTRWVTCCFIAVCASMPEDPEKP